jgi:hypothetical protein
MRRDLGDRASATVDTVDELLLDRLDLLKIRDGARAVAILEGASASIWRFRPRLCIAVRDEDQMADLAERIAAFGYRRWRIETPYFNPANFNRREVDLFNGQTALALLAFPEETDVAPVAQTGCVEI